MRSAGGRAGVESGQRQPGRPSGWVRLAALVYVAALALVTLLPIAPVRRPSDYEPQLVPFEGILGELATSPVERLAELFGNVLLFAPLGFLLPLLVPAIRRWWQALAVGAGVSLLIELYQLAWPGVRKASVNDVLVNALGALLGFAALRLTGYRRSGSSRRAQGASRPGRPEVPPRRPRAHSTPRSQPRTPAPRLPRECCRVTRSP